MTPDVFKSICKWRDWREQLVNSDGTVDQIENENLGRLLYATPCYTVGVVWSDKFCSAVELGQA